MKKVTVSILAATLMLGLIPTSGNSESLPKCGKVSREVSNTCACITRDLGPVPASVPASHPLSLAECYAMSLKQSEIIAIDADQIRIADARFIQALSVMLPHVSFISVDEQEQAAPPAAVPSSATGSEFASQQPSTSSERRFNARQTLFNGFKAFAAIKGSRAERNQRIGEKVRAEQLLLVDVANAFYLLIETREDQRALERIRMALRGRIDELRPRERLGRSRPSEVVNAKAQLYTVESMIEVVKNQQTLSRQLLEFLVGVPVRDLVDPYDIPSALQDVGYYVMKSDYRPDVQAAKYAALVAKQESRIVDSDFLPTAYVDVNGYTQRTGFNKGVDWDVTLRVDVPIFDGGLTVGRSQEFALKADQRDLEFKRLRRRAPYDIKDAYASLWTALQIHDSLRKAYTTARLNYYLQKKDYLRSLVSNLDVLASIQTLQDAQRNYIHALYEAKRLYWRLRVAVGEGIAETLNDTF